MSNQELETYPGRFRNASFANGAAGASAAVFPGPSNCSAHTKRDGAAGGFRRICTTDMGNKNFYVNVQKIKQQKGVIWIKMFLNDLKKNQMITLEFKGAFETVFDISIHEALPLLSSKPD